MDPETRIVDYKKCVNIRYTDVLEVLITPPPHAPLALTLKKTSPAPSTYGSIFVKNLET